MSWGASRAALVGVLTGLVVTGGIVVTAGLADAKSTCESPYGYDRTWNAAVRMILVDNNWKVTDKDHDDGYLLFDYVSPENSNAKKKTSQGTFEFVRGRDGDAPVSVLVQLPEMPKYQEQMLLDQLSTKMRHEYGDPPVHKKRQPVDPPDAGDAGAD
jgi:hypothetical protein